jgi:hypothetical protein
MRQRSRMAAYTPAMESRYCGRVWRTAWAGTARRLGGPLALTSRVAVPVLGLVIGAAVTARMADEVNLVAVAGGAVGAALALLLWIAGVSSGACYLPPARLTRLREQSATRQEQMQERSRNYSVSESAGTKD